MKNPHNHDRMRSLGAVVQGHPGGESEILVPGRTAAAEQIKAIGDMHGR